MCKRKYKYLISRSVIHICTTIITIKTIRYSLWIDYVACMSFACRESCNDINSTNTTYIRIETIFHELIVFLSKNLDNLLMHARFLKDLLFFKDYKILTISLSCNGECDATERANSISLSFNAYCIIC